MANLYEIRAEIESCIDMETGEIIDIEKLDALQMERDEKIENILCWVKNLRSDIAGIREEEKALAERRRSAERKAESLIAYVSQFLTGSKWSSPRVQASWRKSTVVSIDDEEATLRWCEAHADGAIKYSAPTLDKTAIKDLLKAGVEVDGARLEDRQNIQIK